MQWENIPFIITKKTKHVEINSKTKVTFLHESHYENFTEGHKT